LVGSIQQALELLGVTADSDPVTLARAYRRLARTNHPDLCTDPDAAERFAAIATAYHLIRDHAEPPAAAPIDPAATPNRTPVEQPATGTTSVIFRPAELDQFWPHSTGHRADNENWSLVRLMQATWPGEVSRPSPIVAGPVRISPLPSRVTSAGPDE
jgi:hypothetical protein